MRPVVAVLIPVCCACWALTLACAPRLPLPRSDVGGARATLTVVARAGAAASAALLVSASGSQSAVATGPSSVLSPAAGPTNIISPGFAIPSACYDEISRAFGAASLVCSYAGDESLEASSRRLRKICEGEGSCAIIGHSRGGSVAVDVALQLGPRRISRLVLLDPVDDAALTTLRKLELQRAPLPPCLLLSTPWAGTSSYYRYNYESACAPPARSAPTFSRALAGRSGGGGARSLLVEVPSLGHLSMLSHPEALPAIQNLCGSSHNPALAPPRLALLQSAVRDLMVAWAAGAHVEPSSPLVSAIRACDPAARAFLL